jgi:hypothetical protein
LAVYDEKTQKARLIGWTISDGVEQWPKKDFGYGVINHYKSAEELLSMEKLKEFLRKI